jgi:hypothetical protein
MGSFSPEQIRLRHQPFIVSRPLIRIMASPTKHNSGSAQSSRATDLLGVLSKWDGE